MIRRFSVQKLNYLSLTNEIWCIGCGKRLNDMLRMYRNEVFVEKISVLMDNNCKLWGVWKQTGRKEVAVCGTNIIKEKGNKHVLLIITSDNYMAIYKEIAKDIKARKMISCLYPVYYRILTKTIMNICCHFPLKRQLLFYAGKEPHENADAIVQYLKNEYQGKKYRIVYLTDKEEKEAGIIYLSKKSICCKSSVWQVIRYCWFYSKSAFLFYENEYLAKVRSDQKLIYLNHGTIPLKKVSDVLKQPRQVDYALCPSRGCAKLYNAQYGIPIEKQLYIMPPRVWFLFQKKHVLYNWINRKKKQVIIWLPTFRRLKGTQRTDSFLVNPFPLLTEEDGFQKVDKTLEKNNQLLLIKKHPREKGDLKIPDFCKNIVSITEETLQKKGLLLQEVLGETAALITDYSGIAFEYMLLKRPICYVITDMKEYFRGFAVDHPFDYMPGVKVQTLSELLNFLESVRLGMDEYQKERNNLIKQLFGENRYKNGAKELIAALDNIRK